MITCGWYQIRPNQTDTDGYFLPFHLCSLPLGLIAIYRSTQCRDAVRRGDMKTAKVRSRQAKTLSYWSLGFGTLCLFAAVTGFGVYLFSLYRQELRLWMNGPIAPPVHIDRSQDDRPPVTRCCMQSWLAGRLTMSNTNCIKYVS